MVTTLSKCIIFILLPTLAGMMGLYAAYLTNKHQDPDRKLSIEGDFGLPFMLTLLLVVIIGFQTGGYSSSQVKPLVKWPKVKKTRKIIHKHVVKSDSQGGESNVTEQEMKKNK